jgi:predicted nucleic acid-binding protein
VCNPAIMAAALAPGAHIEIGQHGRRVADLLIAAVAHANRLTLYTRNPDDFRGLEGLITVTAI